MTKVVLYVGTYTQRLDHVDGKGQGIHAFEMDVTTGALAPLSVLPIEQSGVNPSYVCCSATAFGSTHKTLYAVNETDATSASSSSSTGYVRAFAIQGHGVLRPLSQHETTGAWPCHVSIWDRAGPHGAFVAVSNYGGGSVALYPIDPQDGSLRPACDVHAFTGASHAVPDRQEAAHVHSATWLHQPGTAASLLVADLGNDRVAQLTLDATSQALRPLRATPFLTRPPGSGPRHLAIHPTLRMVYVLDELSSTIGVHAIVDDVEHGGSSVAPVAMQQISTLPTGVSGANNLGADLHLSTCGRYLFASNRGHDSIASFRVHTMPATTDPHPHPRGWLEPLGHTSTRGAFPRGFLVYRDWLLVANQNSDTIEVFQIDGDSGALRHSGHSAACPTPVSLCIPSE